MGGRRKVWKNFTSVNPNYKRSHSYDSRNQPKYLKGTTIVLKQELNKSDNHQEWHINDDSTLGEDGTTNRFHLIKRNVKKSKWHCHLLSLNTEMKQHKKEMADLLS